MKVYTICGSMRFAKEMKKIAWEFETKEGICVLQCSYDEDKHNESLEDLERVYACHVKKMELADAIYVVNVGGYIGEGTKNDIHFAETHGIDIIYHEQPKDKTTINKKVAKVLKEAPKKEKKAVNRAKKSTAKTTKKVAKSKN